MCGGCNNFAESAGASVIFARSCWVARQGRLAVIEAERLLAEVPVGVDFVDPLPAVLSIA
jgi:hypothetical protein